MKEKISNLIRKSLAAELGMSGGEENWQAAERLIDAESTFSGENAWRMLRFGVNLAQSEASKRCIKKVMEKFQNDDDYSFNYLLALESVDVGIRASDYTLLHGVIKNNHFTTDEAKTLIDLMIDKGARPTQVYSYNLAFKTAIELAFFSKKEELFDYMVERLYGKSSGARALALVWMYTRRHMFSEDEKSRLVDEIGQCGLMALKAYFDVNAGLGNEYTSSYKAKQADFERLVEQCRTNTLPPQREFERQSKRYAGWTSKQYATIRDAVYHAVLSDPEKRQAAYEQYLNAKNDEIVSVKFTGSMCTIAAPVASSAADSNVAKLRSVFEQGGAKHKAIAPKG